MVLSVSPLGDSTVRQNVPRSAWRVRYHLRRATRRRHSPSVSGARPPTSGSSYHVRTSLSNIDDALRKEAGCTTELDYTEQTSWLLFLKYLDGLEQDRADEAELDGKKYTYILDKPYRWETLGRPQEQGRHARPRQGHDRRRPRRLRRTTSSSPTCTKFKQKADRRRTPSSTRSARSSARSKTRFSPATTSARSSTTSTSCASARRPRSTSSRTSTKPRSGTWATPAATAASITRPARSSAPSIKVVKPELGQKIYDGAVGSAGFLCEAYDYLKAEHPKRTTAQDKRPAGEDLLRQGEEVPRLRHRDHEHDPARHRSPEHRPHQHAHREPRRHPGEGPLRHRPGQSALRRQGAHGSPAELPHPHRRNRLPLPPALHQDAQGRRPRRRGHQEHLPLQHRQRLGQPAQDAAGIAATCTPSSTAPAARSWAPA